MMWMLAIGYPVAWALKRRKDLVWLWGKPTNWSAVQRAYGYTGGPLEGEYIPRYRPPRHPRLLAFWRKYGPAIDWEAEKKRLGYPSHGSDFTGSEAIPPEPD